MQGLAEEDLRSHGFSTKPGHAGAGLAIVTSIAEAAGGYLKVERQSVGTVFEVVVPNG